MRYEHLWERLLDFLNTWGTATETEPGRIEVVAPLPDGSTREVEIVMTRQQWDDLVSIPFGDFDLAAAEVRSAVLALRDDDRFLVYATYELVPSPTRVLPADPEEERLTDLAREHPDGIGHWSPAPPDDE